VFIQEQSLGIHYNKGGDLLDYIKDPEIYRYKNGFLDIMTGPGLGVDVNEEALREAAKTAHNWKNPIWRNFDGTVAEW
jgi:galactonate dehydratase